MSAIFGPDHSSKEAQAWTAYWTKMGNAEEKQKDGDKFTWPPLPLIAGSVPDADVGKRRWR
ncbi:hypothetical protein B0H10DRAFT_2220223 [Mycena sp. CBHHK59/15]|nr:hypothetical protein B0H10DRAFT_2220223 [Mycena sp. CBHHK59/15]